MNWFRGLFTQAFQLEDPASEEEDKSQAEAASENSVMGGAQKARRRSRARATDGNLTRKQKLVEMEKRAKVLKNTFREILYRNVCMSLFEHHKLLFAFFISLKVYERDKSFQEGLERLQKMTSGPKSGASMHEKSKLD